MLTTTAKSLVVLLFVLMGDRFVSGGQKTASPPKNTESVVDLSVVVRDRHSNPVTGLTRDDFIIQDQGRNVFATVRPVRLAGAPDASADTGPSPSSDAGDPVVPVSILVMIPPMSIEGRYYALRAAAKYLQNVPQGFQVAVIDASGNHRPFTSDVGELQAFVNHLQHIGLTPGMRPMALPYLAPNWKTDLQDLMDEESIRPGIRSAVVFADLDVFSPLYTGLARQHGIALYIADARGLVTGIPYGDATAQAPFGPGAPSVPMSAGSNRAWAVHLQGLELEQAAEETGGRAWFENNDLTQIFHAVEDDAKGSYELRLYIRREKSHRIVIAVARLGSKVIIRPSFTKEPGKLVATATNAKGGLSAIDLGSLPLKITPTVAYFPSHRNGLFMLAMDCSIRAGATKSAELPSTAQLSVQISSDLEGTLRGITRPLSLKAESGEVARYTALAKLPAGSYTLTFAIEDAAGAKVPGSQTGILGLRLYRILIHPQYEQPLYASSLLVGDLLSGSTGKIDIVGFANRTNSVLLNNPLDFGNRHFAFRPGNEFSGGEDFSVVAKIYAEDKLKREIRETWIKSAVILSITGQVVAGPFAGNSEDTTDGGVAAIFPVHLHTIAKPLPPGSYEIRVDVKPSHKSDKDLILTAPLTIK